MITTHDIRRLDNANITSIRGQLWPITQLWVSKTLYPGSYSGNEPQLLQLGSTWVLNVRTWLASLIKCANTNFSRPMHYGDSSWTVLIKLLILVRSLPHACMLPSTNLQNTHLFVPQCKTFNLLPAEALGGPLLCIPKLFRHRVRKAITNTVKWKE